MNCAEHQIRSRCHHIPCHLLCPIAGLLHNLQTLPLHEAKHVEEAIVTGWCEALLKAQAIYEVWWYRYNICCCAAAQALHQ